MHLYTFIMVILLIPLAGLTGQGSCDPNYKKEKREI